MTPETPRRIVERAGLLFVALAAAVCAVFWGTLRNDPVWDDAWLTTNNPFIRGLIGLPRLFASDLSSASASEEVSSYYRPVAMASFAANRLISGNSSASYHAGNMVLHAVNALFVALLVGWRRSSSRLEVLLLPALWFALAPVNVEAVAWISGRFDLLGTAFVLSALLVNVRAGGWARGGTALLIAAALLCKESFVVAPVLVILQDTLVLHKRPRVIAKASAAYALIIGAFFVARALVGVMSTRALSTTGIGPILRSYAFLLPTFARTLVFPTYLDPCRTYVTPSVARAASVLGAATLAGVFVVLAALRRPGNRRIADFAFGVVWVLVAFTPVALTGPNLEMVGDRYGYFPLVGAFLAVGAVGRAAWPRAPVVRAIAVVVVGTCLVAFGFRAKTRVADWRTERTLFDATLRDDRDNPYGLYFLGYLEALDHRFPEADALLQRSLARNASSWRTLNALCFVRLNQNRPRAAQAYCERSLQIQPGDPRTWINLASARIKDSAWAPALEASTRAATLKPRSAEAHYLRAVCLANLGDLVSAREELRLTLGLDPAHVAANSLLRQFDERGVP